MEPENGTSHSKTSAVMVWVKAKICASGGSCARLIHRRSAFSRVRDLANSWTEPHSASKGRPELIGDKDQANMSDLYPSLTQCAVVATAFKVLLWPA